MPNVKQVDFDLNTINSELTGEDTDLHREIMPNLIQQNPYVLKVKALYPSEKKFVKNQPYRFRVEAVGKGLHYKWGQILNTEFKTFSLQVDGNEYYRQLSALFDGMYVACKVTDKYGNEKISEPIKMTMIN